MESIELLQIKIHNFSRKKLAEKIRTSLRSKTFLHIATVNPEFLVEAKKDKNFREILQTSSLNLCDGFGIELLSKLLYKKKITRIPGVEIADIVCRICAEEGKSIYLLGGYDVAKKVQKKLAKKYPSLRIIGAEDGDPKKISVKLKKAQPTVVLVAYGMKKQEMWIQKFAQKNNILLSVGVGGTFDFWSGKIPRAPQIMQKMGLEWVWRLAAEPGRILRIFRATIVFPYLCLREKFAKK